MQKITGHDIAWVVKDGKVERRAVTVAESNGNAKPPSAPALPLAKPSSSIAPATLTDGAAVTVETSR